jgi:hypothetical protein
MCGKCLTQGRCTVSESLFLSCSATPMQKGSLSCPPPALPLFPNPDNFPLWTVVICVTRIVSPLQRMLSFPPQNSAADSAYGRVSVRVCIYSFLNLCGCGCVLLFLDLLAFECVFVFVLVQHVCMYMCTCFVPGWEEFRKREGSPRPFLKSRNPKKELHLFEPCTHERLRYRQGKFHT